MEFTPTTANEVYWGESIGKIHSSVQSSPLQGFTGGGVKQGHRGFGNWGTERGMNWGGHTEGSEKPERR